jgi:DNA-binding response OmpR family regulator
MATARSSKTPDGKRNPRVLIVEDDTFLSGMYVTKLTMEHLDVSLASDGREALKAAKTLHPDIILLDLILPKMSGFDVLSEIRKDPALKMTPVILLTNLGEKSDVRRGLELGATDYLIKAHFLPSEVVTKIKRYLKLPADAIG